MNRAAVIMLTPLSSIYGVAMKARRALYQRGLFRTYDLGVPVISVGNITTGGTGKLKGVKGVGRYSGLGEFDPEGKPTRNENSAEGEYWFEK